MLFAGKDNTKVSQINFFSSQMSAGQSLERPNYDLRFSEMKKSWIKKAAAWPLGENGSIII